MVTGNGTGFCDREQKVEEIRKGNRMGGEWVGETREEYLQHERRNRTIGPFSQVIQF